MPEQQKPLTPEQEKNLTPEQRKEREDAKKAAEAQKQGQSGQQQR